MPRVILASPSPPRRRDSGGLRLRHPLDAHQVEDFPLVLRQLVDRPEHAAAVRGETGARCWTGAGTSPSHSSTAAGCSSKRRARSLTPDA